MRVAALEVRLTLPPTNMAARMLPYRQAKLARGVTLAYTDSFDLLKAPAPARYTTVIAHHGVGFNAGERTSQAARPARARVFSPPRPS